MPAIFYQMFRTFLGMARAGMISSDFENHTYSSSSCRVSKRASVIWSVRLQPPFRYDATLKPFLLKRVDGVSPIGDEISDGDYCAQNTPAYS